MGDRFEAADEPADGTFVRCEFCGYVARTRQDLIRFGEHQCISAYERGDER